MNGENCVRKLCQKSVSIKVGQQMTTPIRVIGGYGLLVYYVHCHWHSHLPACSTPSTCSTSRVDCSVTELYSSFTRSSNSLEITIQSTHHFKIQGCVGQSVTVWSALSQRHDTIHLQKKVYLWNVYVYVWRAHWVNFCNRPSCAHLRASMNYQATGHIIEPFRGEGGGAAPSQWPAPCHPR